MDGADISWIVSLVLTSVLYHPLAKRSLNVPADMVYPDGEDPGAPARAAAPVDPTPDTGRRASAWAAQRSTIEAD